MPVRVDILGREARVPLVRFKSAARVGGNLTDTQVDAARPLIDDRAPATQPVVLGLKGGSRVRLVVERLNLDAATPLAVRSSNPGAVRVASPAEGRLPSGATADVELEASAASASDVEADVEIRHEDLVLHRLRVVVRPVVRVGVAFYRVHVKRDFGDGATVDGSGAPAPPADRILEKVNAIWSPAAVEFVGREGGATAVDVACEAADVVNIAGPDLAALFAAGALPGRINVYFVRGIVIRGTNSAGEAVAVPLLGWSATPDVQAERSLPAAGVLTADPDWDSAARTIAHEFGHFLSLQHTYEVPSGDAERAAGAPATRELSPYFLMHWRAPIGHFIPMKRVPSGSGGLVDNGVAEARAGARSAGYVLP